MSETKQGGGAIPEENEAAPKTAAEKAAAEKAAAKAAEKAAAAAPGAPARAPRVEARPAVPEGFVLLQNGSEEVVRYTLRDGENVSREVRVAPGAYTLVPAHYADVVPNRAPQLRRVAE